ncbi:MAG TPA: glycosyltransferase family 1 protein, partial [bacterium]|nr:glycosyltransferase family 1 protein [bacterium]
MRIGINALYAIPGKVGGSEIYLRCLLAALARVDSENEYVVFTNRESAGRLALGENFREAPLGVRAVNRPARALWEQTALPRRCRREGVDLLHSLGSSAPLRLSCPSVVTVLDL